MQTDRGSAFILVVGMMVALAMIGTVFFMITRSDTKESVGASEAAAMHGVAQAQVERIATMLLEDLHIGPDGPYSGSNEPRAFMDYASPHPDKDTDLDDVHLASTEVAWADGGDLDGTGVPYPIKGRWPQISNVAGYTHERTGVWLKNVDPAWPYVVVGDNWADTNNPLLRALVETNNDSDRAPDAIPYVDTDGDGLNDAILYPTGVFDRNGEQYYAAIRLVDLSAMINVNTAWFQSPDVPQNPDTWPDLTAMHLQGIGLSGVRAAFANALPANSIHAERCDAPVRSVFMDQAAGRPENPEQVGAGYRLYGWADEFACRWRQDAEGAASRLERAIGVDSKEWRWHSRFLTTASASRDLSRPGDNGGNAFWSAPKYKVDLNLPLDTNERKLEAFDLYRRAFYHVLPDLPDDVRRVTAGQLAVNLVDYLDADSVPSYVPSSRTGTPTGLFGVEIQPFLTMAWVKINRDGDGSTNDGTDVNDHCQVALVLHNPYSRDIEVTNDWTVGDSIATVNLSPGTIQPGQWYVIWASSDPSTPVQFAGGMTATDASALMDLRAKDLDEALTVRRPAEDLTGLNPAARAAVATIEWSTFGLEHDDDSASTPRYWRLSRDDRAGRHHVALEAYCIEDTTSGVTWDYTTTPIPAALNDPTIIHDAAQMDLPNAPAKVAAERLPPVPVFVRGDSGRAARMVSAGELSRLLVVGPGAYSPVDQQLSSIDSPRPIDYNRFPLGVSANVSPNYAVGRLDSWAFRDVADPYPDVPSLCLAADYFTTDSPFGDYDTTGSPVKPADNDADGIGFPGAMDVSRGTWLNAADVTDEMRNRESVVHGRLNINTATLDALTALPLLEEDGTDAHGNWRLQLAADLIAYRDGLSAIVDGGFLYNNYEFNGSATDPRDLPADLRTVQEWRGAGGVPPNPTVPNGFPALRTDLGFASAGEPAVMLRLRYGGTPLERGYEVDVLNGSGYLLGANGGDDGYARALLWEPAMSPDRCDLTKYERRFTYMANLLAVNSDTYCAYIWVQLGPQLNPATSRRYMAILDRSNCFRTTDRPLIRAFMEVK
ncbi:MAG: lamin tail domain-containing protein [Planctomycetes bacterium]|nr:lamin tail domain-containing protein [Planctomycetota bacterium]